MQYDPIKRSIGSVIEGNVSLRKVFYFLLGMLFLREWYVKRALARVLKSGKFSLYDAGSGFGQYTYFVASHYPEAEILAVDVKQEQIDECRRFFQKAGLSKVQFKVEDLTTITHSEAFEVILSVDVMEHILDDVAVFGNFYRALKPGGTVIINTPSDLAEDHDHEHEQEGSMAFVDEHVRDGYSPKEMEEKLVQAGFTSISISYTYGMWGNLYWHLALKYPMRLLGVSKLFFLILPLYYLLVYPVAFLFMVLDYSSSNPKGSGILVTAKKPT